MTISDHDRWMREAQQRERARKPIDRAREAANESAEQCNNDVIRGRAVTLTALATAEALDRIARALERLVEVAEDDLDPEPANGRAPQPTTT